MTTTDCDLPEESKRLLQALQFRDAGLAEAAAVLQRERDVIAAEWTRAVGRVKATAPSGYELGPSFTYVKKSDQT